MTAAALGWISGFPDGTFRPDTPIYRAEVVTIVNHMLGRSADRTYVNAHTEKLQAFSDLTDSGKWYYYDMPVTLDSIHYIKVQTASNVIAGATGEKSTEVNAVARAEAGDKDVGVTTAPTAIAVDNNKLDLSDGQYVYNATVSGVFDVVVTAGSGDNVYINNKRASDVSFRDIPDHGIIRVIVQNGEKEPLIYYLKVVDDGQSTDNQVTAITFDADGGKIGDYSSVTRYYDVNSSAVFPTPVREGYAFLGWYYGQKPYSTINTDMPSALTLTAKWKNNDSGGSPTKTISVKFRLIGATLSADHIDLSNGDYKGSKYVT